MIEFEVGTFLWSSDLAVIGLDGILYDGKLEVEIWAGGSKFRGYKQSRRTGPSGTSC